MRTIIITALLVMSFIIFGQAQNKVNSSDQSRSIEINNDNGELYISFLNGVITEFTVNDIPVAEELYVEYQDILDTFTEDDVLPPPPPTPAPPINEENHSADLQDNLVEYLLDNSLIRSSKKYTIQLNRKMLKVDGQELDHKFHQDCLDIFDEIYGHALNHKSEVKFKKSKNKSRSSVRIAA